MRQRAQNWDAGADGEARTADRLAQLPPTFSVLHDLIVPGSTANIDHLVIGPTGVWLLDTKAYSAPLRYSEGTIWHGKYPMRKETAAVTSYATAAAAILRVPVTPVLCFVDNDVPAGASVLGSVRLVSLDQLLDLVTSRDGVPIEDPHSVARLARTLRTPTPDGTADAAPASPVPTGRPKLPRTVPSRRSQRIQPRQKAKASRRSRRRKKESGSLLGMAFVLAVLIAACVALNGTGSVPNGATSTTITPPPLDGPTIGAPSPPIGIGATCVERGSGWQIGFVWPTSADPEPHSYEVVSMVPEVTIEPRLWVGKAGMPDRITGLAPSTTVTISAQAILEDGTRLAPTPTTRVTPAQPC